MKKMYQVSNWNISEVTSVDHWLIKSLNDCFAMLGVQPTFTLGSVGGSGSYAYKVQTITIDGYEGSVQVGISTNNYRGLYSGTSPFYWYVNTETKEIFGCVNNASEVSYRSGRTIASTFYRRRVGPLVAIKLKDNKIMGYCIGESIITIDAGSNNTALYFPSQIGSPLPDCNSVTTSVAFVTYEEPSFNTPILLGITSRTNYLAFNGDYFEDIFDTTHLFSQIMIGDDNKSFAISGKLFIVDDATDIGTIETTV